MVQILSDIVVSEKEKKWSAYSACGVVLGIHTPEETFLIQTFFIYHVRMNRDPSINWNSSNINPMHKT